MTRVRFTVGACSAAALCLALVTPRTVADDKAPPAKPTIEFRNFPGKPGDGGGYKFSLFVEVEGSNEKFESKDNSAGSAFSGAALASFLGDGEMKQYPGWKYTVDGNKLVIEGWTDPKTKTFHPVKKIRFESPNLPKESFPTVTNPTKKG